MADLANDLGDRSAAFLTARIRDDAERAAHVAALHDRDEGGRLTGFRHMVANRILRAFLLGGVADAGAAQGVKRIVHARLQPPLEDAIHILENLVVFLCAHDDIELGERFEKLLAAGLGHAAHEAVNDVFPIAPLVDQVAHFPERLLLGLVPNRAGIDEHRVRFLLFRRDGVATLAEHPHDLLGVALVHLAAVSLDVNLGHGKRFKIAG